nr:MAG TPA: hypothetical protein [Caudoviricetes sp.]
MTHTTYNCNKIFILKIIILIWSLTFINYFCCLK